MQHLFVLAIIFYVLGTAGYYAYLFFQRNGLQRVGWWLQGVGFLCQTLLMVWTYMKTGHMPANNLHETLSLVAWALVGVHLGISLKFKIKILGIYAAPLAVLILLVATQFPKEPMQPLDLLKGIWLTTHIITVFIGDAALALAAGTGLLYLIQEHSIKTKTRGFFFRRLPSLELLDNTGHACIVVGFTLLTIGLISGMIYAKIKWSGFWILVLGSQRGMVSGNLAFLCRAAPRTIGCRVARTQGGHNGHRWTGSNAVYFFRGQLPADGTPWPVYAMVKNLYEQHPPHRSQSQNRSD